MDAFERRIVEKTAKLSMGNYSDDDEGGTGIMTSQLRHFVIQVNYHLLVLAINLAYRIGIYAQTDIIRYIQQIDYTFISSTG